MRPLAEYDRSEWSLNTPLCSINIESFVSLSLRKYIQKVVVVIHFKHEVYLAWITGNINEQVQRSPYSVFLFSSFSCLGANWIRLPYRSGVRQTNEPNALPRYAPTRTVMGNACQGRSQSRGIGMAPNHAPRQVPKAPPQTASAGREIPQTSFHTEASTPCT